MGKCRRCSTMLFFFFLFVLAFFPFSPMRSQAGGPAALPFSENFESGALGGAWTARSTGSGRVVMTTANGPHGGKYHVTMDSSQEGIFSLNELILTVDLAGKSGVMLSFYHKEFGEREPCSPGLLQGIPQRRRGVHQRRWEYLVPGKKPGCRRGRQLGMEKISGEPRFGGRRSPYQLQQQLQNQIAEQYDNSPIPSDGFALDDIQVYARTGDTDGDGLPDEWETRYFGTLGRGPGGDEDSDGLTNLAEYQLGTNPVNPDSDGDGMPDGWEVQFTFNPLDPSDANADPDGDGKTNLEEYLAGTDPLAASAAFPSLRISKADGWEVGGRRNLRGREESWCPRRIIPMPAIIILRWIVRAEFIR